MFGFFRRLKTGNQLMSSLITGEFDESEVGKQLAAWFAERSERAAQRDMFLKVVHGMGAKPEAAAMRLMDCIMKSWGGGQFGQLLSQQLDSVISFDAPRDSAQAEQQSHAKSLLNGLKQELQALDEK